MGAYRNVHVGGLSRHLTKQSGLHAKTLCGLVPVGDWDEGPLCKRCAALAVHSDRKEEKEPQRYAIAFAYPGQEDLVPWSDVCNMRHPAGDRAAMIDSAAAAMKIDNRIEGFEIIDLQRDDSEGGAA